MLHIADQFQSLPKMKSFRNLYSDFLQSRSGAHPIPVASSVSIDSAIILDQLESNPIPSRNSWPITVEKQARWIHPSSSQVLFE
jgi:hypothetical protein